MNRMINDCMISCLYHHRKLNLNLKQEIIGVVSHLQKQLMPCHACFKENVKNLMLKAMTYAIPK